MKKIECLIEAQRIAVSCERTVAMIRTNYENEESYFYWAMESWQFTFPGARLLCVFYPNGSALHYTYEP